MKKITTVIFSLFIIVLLSSCGNDKPTEQLVKDYNADLVDFSISSEDFCDKYSIKDKIENCLKMRNTLEDNFENPKNKISKISLKEEKDDEIIFIIDYEFYDGEELISEFKDFEIPVLKEDGKWYVYH